MYQPPAFREEDPARLRALIDRFSFAMVIVATASGVVEIAHVPVVFDGERLRFHVAMANAIWRAALKTGRVTVVFSGPHAYVSASWYEHPTQQVPTWNYAVVHAHGTPSRLDDDALLALLDDLTKANEPKGAWQMGALDPKVRDDLVRAIVGLEVSITRLEGKLKLSQNRSPVDHARVIEAFRERGETDLVSLMEKSDAENAHGRKEVS